MNTQKSIIQAQGRAETNAELIRYLIVDDAFEMPALEAVSSWVFLSSNTR